MKSRKIRRLEFVSDKIEGGDCKREVMCICFGHPMTKKRACVRLSMRGHSWPELELHGQPWRARRRGRERGERRQGARLGGGGREGAMGRGCYGGEFFCTWEEELNMRKKRRRKERRKRKGRKRKEKRKKYGNFSKSENFQKIKDNLWSWSNIILYKKGINLIIIK
jgi:hypothetical protein